MGDLTTTCWRCRTSELLRHRARGHYLTKLTRPKMTFGDSLHHLGEVSSRMQETADVSALSGGSAPYPGVERIKPTGDLPVGFIVLQITVSLTCVNPRTSICQIQRQSSGLNLNAILCRKFLNS